MPPDVRVLGESLEPSAVTVTCLPFNVAETFLSGSWLLGNSIAGYSEGS